MPTLTAPPPIGTLIERLRALHVRVSVFVMPTGTVVDECRYRDHDTLEPIPAVVDLYVVDEPDDEHLEVCLSCAVHIAAEREVRRVDVQRIENPTIQMVADELVVTPARVSVVDRDGRFASVERVGVEVEIAVLGKPALAFDLSTPAGLAAARVIRAQLDAAIAQAA